MIQLLIDLLWRRRHCEHLNLRCIHGDEIIWTGFKRARCLDCGKLLEHLPVVCAFTGWVH